MEKKYVIFDIVSKETFCGADWEGAYFGYDGREFLYFDTEVLAETRLESESKIHPIQFENRVCAILSVFKLKTK